MIYFFRGLAIFSFFQLIVLSIFGGAAGMVPVWVGVGLGAFCLSFRKIYKKCFGYKVVKIFFTLGVLVFVGIEGWIIWTSFNSVPIEQNDFIIVLGAQVRGETPSLTLQYRLDSAYEYLEENPQTLAILSGGQGPDEGISEAEAMRRYLVDKGISEERLILEDKSTNTEENLKYSFEIIENIKEESKVSIVTNRFHVLRGKLIAADLGKKVGGIGAKNYVYLIPNYYLREFFAVVKEIVF